jgi:hypothetical protein
LDVILSWLQNRLARVDVSPVDVGVNCVTQGLEEKSILRRLVGQVSLEGEAFALRTRKTEEDLI